LSKPNKRRKREPRNKKKHTRLTMVNSGGKGRGMETFLALTSSEKGSQEKRRGYRKEEKEKDQSTPGNAGPGAAAMALSDIKGFRFQDQVQNKGSRWKKKPKNIGKKKKGRVQILH